MRLHGGLLLAATLGSVVCLATAARAQTVLNVTDGASLSSAIATIDTNPTASGYIINFENNITLTSAASNTLNAFNATSNVTVNGNGFTLDGGGVQRGFFVYSGAVTINNLIIQNAIALGGAGGNGNEGGGGGMGAGGALFIASGAGVTVNNVQLNGNSANGGAGGTSNGATGFGGGGGLGGGGGNGGSSGVGGGGGGGVGLGANGGIGSGGTSGSPGIILRAASGGAGSGGTGGANGGGGGGSFGGGLGGGGGGGGVGGSVGNSVGNGVVGGHGGFGGGGGGAEGIGGFGGGGSAAGAGGFGGGGGSGTGGFGGGIGGNGCQAICVYGGGGGLGAGGALFVQQGGSLTLAGPLTISGNQVNGGAAGAQTGLTPDSAGLAFGTGIFLQGNGTITFAPGGGNTQTISDVVTDQTGSGGTGSNAGSWNIVVNGGGTLVLAGADTYSGTTTVAGSTLVVNGSITDPIINAGGVLSGTGSVGPTTINAGGTLAPGPVGGIGTLTINGALTFNSGSTYAVMLTPLASSSTAVNGAASLGGGTVNAQFAAGSYVAKQYTILTATGGLGTTTFAGLTNVNLPPGFADSLSYNADDAFLNLTAALGAGTPLNANQQNVANAINTYFNSGGTLPPGFGTLFNLAGVPLGNALTQLDGENATGAERGAFDLMNEFLGLMLDPFVDGRGGGAGGSGALGFAPDQANSLPPDIALAYADLLKAPPPQTFAQRWSTWASGFGGSATTDGDPSVGSNNVTTSTYGYAAGLDYHYSPDTVLGFSLAGGGTNWNLANALGSGRSDALLAGVYGVTHNGPWYLGGALAFANNWFTTNRTAAMGDQLNASFQGQSYSARLEGGYRFALPVYHGAVGVTPYAAVQVQDFQTPAYSETDLTAGGFGLSYNAMSGTDTRSELGGRFDDLTALGNLPLILRAKLAWAHDWVSNPALNASFESLPGSSFTVNGAPIPHDSALTSAGAQLFFTPNWSFLAKFDGEFADGYQLYAGTGTLRYTW
jgi:uncharacterized protein with beta-barrel porin domain